ncbi:NUDIX domain-containing protein [Herpetosiphon llansteffanensis]|uniref:NUDIX domain-containing protein n=1 Tax=Herpetosiphon llansteffanensis TaxID=2094568 RepID=UPI000D7C05B5|nr:NUDIX domain-containing protein [Herpetosiphon llansteffanensis]
MASHSVYDNIRTRVIVLREQELLILATEDQPELVWRLPGGGLERGESLAECAAREVWEECGIRVEVGKVAFLREWVIPTYAIIDPEDREPNYGLEVFLYATPLDPQATLHAEAADKPMPAWRSLAEIASMPFWPKELKSLATFLAQGQRPSAIHSFVSSFESGWAVPPAIDWA